MTADIFPLSPNMPDFHVIWRGAAGRPATATCPVTSPEAQPSVIPPNREMAAAAVTLVRIWSSLRSWVQAAPPADDRRLSSTRQDGVRADMLWRARDARHCGPAVEILS